MRRPASTGKITFSLVVVTVAVVACWIGRGYRSHVHYRRIAPGDSVQQVVALLGRPRSVYAIHGTISESWRSEHGFAVAGQPVSEYVYPVPLRPLHEWAIDFDSDGRVIVKNELVSP